MRLCSIEGCGRKHYQHDYCFMHFGRIIRGCLDMRPGLIQSANRPTKFCTLDGCDEKHFAKGYCRKHYGNFLRKGTPYRKYLGTNCKFSGCNNPRKALGYCEFHYARLKKEIPLDAEKYETHRGVKNNNWNGGVSEYPNHWKMKKVRKQKIEYLGSECQICHKLGKVVLHHLDKDKSNHDPNNLIIICQSCHFMVFHKVGRPRKEIYQPISRVAYGKTDNLGEQSRPAGSESSDSA